MTRYVKFGPDAGDVKDALRARHPAFDPGFVGVGRWTCIEEWQNIDLLALDAWQGGDVIGYEVKVSRSDMRSELLKPSKRAAAVAMCTRFYFAVPAGLLTPEERAWQEPEWDPGDFEREPCPGIPRFGPTSRYHRGYTKPGEPIYGGQCRKLRGGRRGRGWWWGEKPPTGALVEVPVPATLLETERSGVPGNTDEVVLQKRSTRWVRCPRCNGKGYIDVSRVEREAPTLWVPNDVGLVVVGDGGASVLKEAPRRAITEPIISWPFVSSADDRLTPENRSRVQRQAINQLVRWVSYRPDPRHARTYGDKVDP